MDPEHQLVHLLLLVQVYVPSPYATLTCLSPSDTLEQDYAPMTFTSGSPQQVVVNVTESLAPDISYDAVPADFVARCK